VKSVQRNNKTPLFGPFKLRAPVSLSIGRPCQGLFSFWATPTSLSVPGLVVSNFLLPGHQNNEFFLYCSKIAGIVHLAPSFRAKKSSQTFTYLLKTANWSISDKQLISTDLINVNFPALTVMHLSQAGTTLIAASNIGCHSDLIIGLTIWVLPLHSTG
jgi:hypothetical protein